MRLADIVVTIDPSRSGRERMRVALKLGAQSGARVVGYYVSPTQGVLEEVERPNPGPGDQQGWTVPRLDVSAGDIAEEVHAEFERETRRLALDGIWVLGEKSSDLLGVIDYSRCADLVVVGLAPVPDFPEDFQGLDIEAVVVGSGRPVLGVPLANVPERIGSSIVLAWDGSREATRALHDALPFLCEATSVRVVSVGFHDHSPDFLERLVSHLRRLGISATIDVDHSLHFDSTGDEILSRLQLPEADLLVAGAFGHSRVQERLFGGASRTFLHQMMIPVLVSH